jgi:coenzyme F420-reducing hydrogenase alpha subunit
VATRPFPVFEQQIRLEAVVSNGRLIAKRLVTTRTHAIADRLITHPVDGIPRILSQLFPLCGIAHAAAGSAAIEAALAIEVSPAQHAFRDLLLLTEHGAALAWRILMEWPPLLGEPPNTRACADVRRSVAVINAVAGRDQWARVGGVKLRLKRDNLSRAVCELARMMIELFPEAASALSWSKLECAIQSGTSVPTRLINNTRTSALADYGRHDRPLLPSRAADWFLVRLAAEPRFCEAPTLDGMPAEVGPLAAQRHPLVADAIAYWGLTLATRLLAAALDAAVVAERLIHTLDKLTDGDPVEVDLTRSGRGAGFVETARGPLAYLVSAADGHVRMLRSVAPTEWNFHPDGPFRAALDAAPRVSDPILAARLLAASFDPCVPFSIELLDDYRPPARAASMHHA